MPLVVAVRILTADWVSAVLVGVTVPLIPLFMVLIGLYTQTRPRRQWRALAVLGHHFVDVVTGLEALPRPAPPGASPSRSRRCPSATAVETMSGLRVAFLSALALERWPRRPWRWWPWPPGCGWSRAGWTWRPASW